MDNGLTTSGSVCSNVNLKSCNYKFNIVFVNVVATVSLVLISTRVLRAACFTLWRGVQTDIEILFSCRRICGTAVEGTRR